MLYAILKVVFSTFFRVLFRAEIIGAENIPRDGAIILAANHLSNWDPPFLACFLERQVSYMAKQELFDIPLFGTAIRHCHAFPVKRGEADRSAIKNAVAILKKGRCLGLFPEGTRSRTGELGKAEAGVGLIAAMTGAPLVPAAISGTAEIFGANGKGKIFPKVILNIGEPMKFVGNRKDKAALEKFSNDVMKRIAELKNAHA